MSLAPVSCSDCGSTFVSASRGLGLRCGPCRRRRPKERGSRSGVPFTFECVGCGESFTIPKPAGRPRSRCDECKTALGRSYDKRRRARKRNVEIDSFTSVEVFERDNWTCWICGKPTLRETLAGFVPNQPTLDHVIPLAKGGAHTLANVKTAHHLCNSLKSDQLVA